ncbi:MAG: PAS domain S-box protein [Thiobacillaceae bacterium]
MNNASIAHEWIERPGPVVTSVLSDRERLRSGVVWVATDGGIQDCNVDAEEMFGYWRDELRGRHISLLFPVLAQTQLTGDYGINPRLAFRCRCSMAFQGRSRNGSERDYSLFFNLISRRMGQVIKIIIV